VRRAFAFFTLASMLAGCGNKGVVTSAVVAQAPVRSGLSAFPGAAAHTNRFVVKYKQSASPAAIRSMHQRLSLRAGREVSSLNLSVVEMTRQAPSQNVLAQLQAHSTVEYVEPAAIFQLPRQRVRVRAAQPVRKLKNVGMADPLWMEPQWGLLKIGMPMVWGRFSGAPRVTVAVIDTGVDTVHPDLAPSIVPGASVVAGTSGPDDDHGHGTHVAGVIAASIFDGRGLNGVAPQCRIMPVKVLDREGKGDTGDIVAGLVWAVNHGAKVVNMSLGGAGGSRALMEAVQYAQSKDVLVVAAMGNEGANSQEYPAGYPGVMAVGATDRDDRQADFSNFCSWISVSAPGVDILSTLPTRPVGVTRNEGKELGQDVMDGTSMAAPFVAGLAGLLRSAYPQLTAAQVKARIERTSDDLGSPGFDPQYGWGRINAVRALNLR
jgi:type VII secretion-associated serine protease mycosin